MSDRYSNPHPGPNERARQLSCASRAEQAAQRHRAIAAAFEAKAARLRAEAAQVDAPGPVTP